MTCKHCSCIVPDDEARVINPSTKHEFHVCQTCFDYMWDANEIINCDHCTEWFEQRHIKDDENDVGGSGFAACPNCGHDMVDGMTREQRIEAWEGEGRNKPYTL